MDHLNELRDLREWLNFCAGVFTGAFTWWMVYGRKPRSVVKLTRDFVVDGDQGNVSVEANSAHEAARMALRAQVLLTLPPANAKP